MSKRQQLVAMHSMLNHVAQEASHSGFSLITTLAAAAAEAARDEIASIDRRTRRPPHANAARYTHREREKIDNFA